MGDVVTALGRAVQEEGHDVSVVREKCYTLNQSASCMSRTLLPEHCNAEADASAHEIQLP